VKQCTQPNTNSTGARECAAHYGMVLSPLAPNGKIKSAKQNTVKHYTQNRATPIGANAMFLKIGKH
jgi:hypothetical protein